MKRLIIILFSVIALIPSVMAQVEQRLTSPEDNAFSRFIRTHNNNLLEGRNQLLQSGNSSNALMFTTSPANGTVTMPDNGLSTTNGFIVSFWFSLSSVANQGLFGYKHPTAGNSYLGIYTDATSKLWAIMQIGSNFGGGTYGLMGPVITGNTKHHVVYYHNNQSGHVRLFVDNIEYTTGYGGGWSYIQQNPGGAFSFGYSPAGNSYSTNLVVDQALFYSTLSDADRIALFNSGNGTSQVPTTGLLRQYDFEEGGTATTTVEKLGTGYDGILNNAHWAGSGLVSSSGAISEVTFFSVRDGLSNAEKGIAMWGDAGSRNQQQGKWFQWYQDSRYPLVSDNSGRWLFNSINTNGGLPVIASTIDVAGNVTIGSGYTGINSAPLNGLLVQGSVGIGTTSPNANLHVKGTLITNNNDANLDGRDLSFMANSAQLLIGWNRMGGRGEVDFIGNRGGGDTGGFGFRNYDNNGVEKQLMWIRGDGKVGIGTTDPKSYKLAVAGSMVAESVTVKLEANWADYVFAPGYALMPLADLKAFIAKKHHLPEIPSAKDVAENGLNLGEINKLLTQKVEELTLYLIEKDEKEKKQEERIKKLEAQMAKVTGDQ